jgi:hypothetical protein
LIPVRIQHHPSRAERIPAILEALADFDDVQVVTDPGHEEKPDHWRSHRACLEQMPEDASHLFVVQDDILPRLDLTARIVEALERYPESVLLTFVPGFPRERRLQMLAHAQKQRFYPFIVGAYVPTVAIIYPRAVVEGLISWADENRGDRHRRPMRGADDGILAHYCRSRRIHPVAMVPCAVEHDHTAESVGKPMRRGSHRRAALI